jgi:hypothetical protein
VLDERALIRKYVGHSHDAFVVPMGSRSVHMRQLQVKVDGRDYLIFYKYTAGRKKRIVDMKPTEMREEIAKLREEVRLLREREA